ncbi:hypothetical protein [Paenibacillus thalictri]|uniref:NIPSNAP domain-containing protein n=1 Tax=Paenibacillus thalictri TaxID=2527873 RepID=A0A4Q9DLY8_9BACL|nr:hypothetical protein [Paenibacillus thalictri]TBL74022.1 hypothetical protein EYB31_26375 [Paenibacillus thalictri]
MMPKVFVEYKVNSDCRDSYLALMKELLQSEPKLTLFEGTDQPGLYVELWEGLPYEEYSRMKLTRTQSATEGAQSLSGWSLLPKYVEGGAQKIHIWHFAQVE